MTDQSIPNEIIEKIRKVINLAENAGTEGEAAAAAAMAQKLLQKYNLSVSQVKATDLRAEHLGDILEVTSFPLSRDSARKSKWIHNLIYHIGQNYFAKPLVTRRTVIFIGREKNAKAATMIFDYLYQVLNRICDEQKEAFVKQYERENRLSPWKVYSPAVWRKSWLTGASRAVIDNLLSQRKEFEATGGSAIILFSQSEIDRYIQDTMGPVHNVRPRQQDTYSSTRNQGYEAGSRISLNNLTDGKG